MLIRYVLTYSYTHIINFEVHFVGYLYIMKQWIVFVYFKNKFHCFYNSINDSIPITLSLNTAICISRKALFGH